MIVAVGSKNPPKVKAVKKIFSKYFSDVEAIPVDVQSGVSEQPLTEEEIYDGAYNRAKAAIDVVKNASYGIGIEGGIINHIHGMYEKAAVVVVDREGNVGLGFSPGLFLPKKITDHIEGGKNLSEAIDEVFGTKDIGRGIGAYGIFTKGVVTRAKGMEQAIAFALSRFLHKKLF